jgi:regulator of nonsense transcripts 3
MLDNLSIVVKQSTFQDTRNTSKDPCLLGPPSLEFAPFGRVPGNRVRKDGRQGTIDQDPEFIDFLQSLTEPVTKSSLVAEGGEGAEPKAARVTTTPLVEFLKEKKANKGKEGAATKTPKPQGKSEVKDPKTDKIDPKNISVVKKETVRSPEKAKVEKATQDAVKAVNKSVALLKGKKDPAESAPVPAKASVTPPSPVKRERERVSASLAAKILQRDLGLTPTRERKISRSANSSSKPPAGAEPDAKTPPASSVIQSSGKSVEPQTSAAPVQSNTYTTSALTTPPTGPRINKASAPSSQSVNKPVYKPSDRPTRAPQVPSLGAKSAFLKHANFSQGVTEELLKTTFSAFGVVTRCEIDRKKGFGYVDFEDSESLSQAMLASPIKVGDKGGQVVVLENKNLKMKPPISVQHSAVAEGKTTAQPPTPPATSTKSESIEDTPTPAPASAAPAAPRGAHVPFRGGVQHHSPRGGYVGPPRGGFGRGGRGARANFRGRAAFDSNRAAVHANGKTSSSTPATAATPPVPKPATDVKVDQSTG